MYALYALAIAAVLMKSVAHSGDTPLTIVGVALFACGVVRWFLWAERPAEPGEFRESSR